SQRRGGAWLRAGGDWRWISVHRSVNRRLPPTSKTIAERFVCMFHVGARAEGLTLVIAPRARTDSTLGSPVTTDGAEEPGDAPCGALTTVGAGTRWRRTNHAHRARGRLMPGGLRLAPLHRDVHGL